MPRTPAQALAQIQHLAVTKADIGTNDCLINAHNIYLIPSNGTPTAAEAWARAQHKHRLPAHPTNEQLAGIPLGAWVFWLGGRTISKITGKPSGHVALWAGFHGGVAMVWSPGAPGKGNANHWTLVPLASIPVGWPGHVLAGWTEDIDGVPVPELAPAPPKKRRPKAVRKVRQALKAALKVASGPVQRKHLKDAEADVNQINKRACQ